MKKIVITSLFSLLVTAAFSQAQTTKYLPLEDQIIYNGNILSYDANNVAANKDVNSLPHDNTMLKLLLKSSSSVSIFSVDSNGSLTVMGNGGTVDKGTYHVIYEYSMFQPVSVVKNNSNITYCVGISVRLIATITTLKANVDLSKIFTLVSASGGTNKFSGQIQITMSGITSQSLTNLVPIPPNGATFTPDNVATALQAVAAIKSHFSDKDVTVTPLILGFYQTSDTAADKNTYSKTAKAIMAQ